MSNRPFVRAHSKSIQSNILSSRITLMGYAAFSLLWEQVNKMQSKVFDKQSKMSIIVVCEVKHNDT